MKPLMRIVDRFQNEKGDERKLGSGKFVDQLLNEAERKTKHPFTALELLEKAKAAMDA